MGCVAFDGAIPDDARGRRRRARAFRSKSSTCSAPATPSWPASCAAGCATSRSRAAAAYANACGALVVSRHGCAPAMPSWDELQHFLRHGSTDARLREDATLEHLHRATTRRPRDWPELAVARLRPPRASSRSSPARACDARAARASQRFKRLVAARRSARVSARTTGWAPACGVDPRRPLRRRRAAGARPAGWWIARPVELPGSRPLRSRTARNVAADAARAGRPSTSPSAWWLPPRRRRRRCARRSSRACAALQARVHRDRPRVPGRGDPAARDAARRRHAGARARRRSTPPASGPTGGSCRRPAATPPGERIAAVDRAPRPALPRRAAARPGGERGRAGAQLRASPRRMPLLPRLRGRPLDLRARRRAHGSPARRATTQVVADVAARYARLIGLWRQAARRRSAAAALPRLPAPSRTRHDNMQRIGFIGIGMMGHGMAKNLLAKGYPLTFKVAPQPRATSPTCSAAGANEAQTNARLVARDATSSSSASPARRRSRTSSTAPTACCAAARDGLIVVDTLDRRAVVDARASAPTSPRKGVALHRRAAGAHAEGGRGRPPEHDGRRRAGRLRALQAGAARRSARTSSTSARRATATC